MLPYSDSTVLASTLSKFPSLQLPTLSLPVCLLNKNAYLYKYKIFYYNCFALTQPTYIISGLILEIKKQFL
jgi:hypothetical protein